MKNFTPALSLMLLGATAFGQQPVVGKAALQKSAEGTTVYTTRYTHDSPETPIWSDNFSNGLTNWTNAGINGSFQPDANAQWELRTATSTPTNATGSRGAYATANDPIVSPTAANGFVIFDSDFKDNAGVAGAFGTGISPTPHAGFLTSPVIDLSANSFVELKFNSYFRKFQGDALVVFSTDGTTWGDTLNVHSNIGVNASTPADEVVTINVSNQIGGSSTAQFRFVFDGISSGDGYYFWMIDDVEINALPTDQMYFTDWNGAPAHDIIMGDHPKTGHTTLKQPLDVTFDANVYNYGSNAQTNVVLTMDIVNSAGTVVFTTTSTSSTASLGMLDTANYNVMNTYSAAWTPTAVDNYSVVYKAVSGQSMVTDTFYLFVTDSLIGQDFSRGSNTIGTAQLGNGGKMASRFDITNDERLFAGWVRISSTTTAGSSLEFEVYDTTSFFDLLNGNTAFPVAYATATISSSDITNGFVRMDFTSSNGGNPIYLDDRSYFMVVTMDASGAGTSGQLRVWNDATYPAIAGTKFMYVASASTWYSGYSNSTTFNIPWLRVITCPASNAAACMQIGIEEVSSLNVGVYPNPAAEYINLSFVDAEGDFNVSVTNVAGAVVMSDVITATNGSDVRMNMSSLTPGVYFMNVSQGNKVNTFKLTIQ